MFRIGDFSRIARVSCRLLRYYDELGLLKPALVHRQTGYRLYSASQLPRLNRILVLKELGLSLDQIAGVLDNNVSTAELRAMLLLRRNDVAQALAAESNRLRQIEARISQIDSEGELCLDDVLIRSEPAHRALTVRDTVHGFADARSLLRQLAESVPSQVPEAILGSLIAIAHSSEFEPDAIDLEMGYLLNGTFERSVAIPGGIVMQPVELPGAPQMAVCVRVGLPEHAHLITAKIGQFAEANGYALAGPSREVFLKPPQLDRMEQSVVEMQFPIERPAPDHAQA